MGRAYTAGLILTGNADGAVKATKLTADELEKLNAVQKRGSSAAKQYSDAMGQVAKTSRLVNDILTGGGLLVGFKSLANHLGSVAKEYASTNSSAATYLRTQDLLKRSFDQGFLLILKGAAPALKQLNDFMDPAALATRRLAVATNDLATAEKALAQARSTHRSGLNAIGGAGSSLADLEKQIRFQQGAVVAANASIKAMRAAEQDANNAFDETGGKDMVENIGKALEEARRVEQQAREKSVSEAKSAADRIAKYNEDLVAERIRNDQAATDATNKYNEDVVQTRMRNQEEAFEGAAKEVAAAQTAAAEEAARQSQEIWNNAAEGIQSALTDAFEGAFDSASDFFDSLKTLAKRTFAELASSAMMKQFSGMLSGASSATASGSSGGASGILGNIGSLWGGGGGTASASGYSGLAGSLATFNQYFGALIEKAGVALYNMGLTSIGKGVANSGVNFASGSAYTGIAGVAGGYAGNMIGESVFNKQANPYVSAVAQTGGAIAGAEVGAAYGSYGGWIGAAIGAAVGAIAATATGKDTSGQRVKLGITAGMGISTGENDSIIGASGLRLGQVGKRLDSKGGDALKGLFDTFAQIDTALTAISRAAGATVDFRNVSLTNPSPANREASASFFGSFSKGSPNAADVNAAADNFVKAWIAQIDAQLPDRVRAGLKGVDQTAAAIVAAFEGLTQIDKLLNLDVVRETEVALEALGRANKTLSEQYRDSTVALDNVSQAYDGSVDSIAKLSQALTEQKTIAVQLAVAYKAAGAQLEGTTKSAIAQIQESILNDEELYTLRRSQIADLTQQISQTQDPDTIASLFAQGQSAAKEAFGLLDPESQKAQAPEFISFLTQLNSLAQTQLQAGLAALSSSETSIKATVDMDLQSAQMNRDAAAQQAATVAQFGAYVTQFGALPQAIADQVRAALTGGGIFGTARSEVNARR